MGIHFREYIEAETRDQKVYLDFTYNGYMYTTKTERGITYNTGTIVASVCHITHFYKRDLHHTATFYFDQFTADNKILAKVIRPFFETCIVRIGQISLVKPDYFLSIQDKVILDHLRNSGVSLTYSDTCFGADRFSINNMETFKLWKLWKE